jgi:NADH:ubiquinone oxidoreductase subunit 6 (subunit J)
VSAEQLLFGVFAACTVAAAGGVIFVRNAIASAMLLVATFFFLAGIYVLLFAHTIAAVQVLVYAGAIMVLFVFVIMLLLTTDTGPVMTFSASRVLGVASVVALFATLVSVFRKLPASDPQWMSDPRAAGPVRHHSVPGRGAVHEVVVPLRGRLAAAAGGHSGRGRRRQGQGLTMHTVATSWYLILAAALFCLGMVGVMIRRNALVVFMSIELMLNAANLTFLAFARERGDMNGQLSARSSSSPSPPPRPPSGSPSSSRCSATAAPSTSKRVIR